MGYRRLIYTSRVARHVRYSDAEQIALAATERNASLGITGLLLYTPSHFIQVLEGVDQVLTATLSRIDRDARHSNLRILDDREVTDREFGAWAMRAQLCLAPAATLEQLTVDGALQLLRAARDEPVP
jgi:hypothetical protein